MANTVALAKAVTEGTYHVDAADLANKLIVHMMDLYKLTVRRPSPEKLAARLPSGREE